MPTTTITTTDPRRVRKFPHLLAGLLGLALGLSAVDARACGLEAWTALPEGVREITRSRDGAVQDVRLELPAGLRLDEPWIEAAQRFYLAEAADDVRGVRLWARDSAGKWRTLPDLLPPVPPVAPRPWEVPPPRSAPAGGGTVVGTPLPGPSLGFLSGKTVYVSPGHGFTWTPNLSRWATQRGQKHNLVEDLLNAEAVTHYLVALLHDAGARVVTVRERDLQTNMAVVDDAGAGYSEQGTFQAGTNKGFGWAAPWQGQANPFEQGGYRSVQAVQGPPTAQARFVPNVPQAGLYAVYTGWTAGTNRVADAHVEIRHAGGTVHLRVDQRKHGGTWHYLGHFWFGKGSDPEHGAVVLHNDTLQPASGKYVIADVVRFGGGVGDVVRGTGKPPAAGPTSGRPRWEECSRYYAQFSGAPPTVYDNTLDDPGDDVSTRSRFAAWDHEEGEPAVYVSWHTNAPSPGRGTSTYVYGPNEPNGKYEFSGVKGSDVLAKIVHKQVIDDIRKVWDPNWKDRGVLSAWFGEVNPKHNPEMPSFLIEAAFHDTKEDADFLREPRFRHLLARAIYKGIAAYFAQQDGVAVQYVPEPPQALQLRVVSEPLARLQWQPGPVGGVSGGPATGYRVQVSADGRAFDLGVEVTTTTYDLPLPPPGTPVFARVVAVGPGGASLPSAVVGASGSCAGHGRALAVQGFTRLEATLAPVDDLSPWGLGQVQRLRQVRMNRFDHLIEHVQALAAAGLSVDSAERSALPGLDLAGYALIDWAAGEQSVGEGGVLSATEQKLLAGWLAAGLGRALLANGAEFAYALGQKGAPADQDFLQTWFGATLASDDAATVQLEPVAGQLPWSGASFDDPDGYAAEYPDSLQALGAQPVLQYPGGAVAAVVHQVGAARTALVGVPLELVHPQAQRFALFQALRQRLGVVTDAVACQGGGPEPAVDAGGQAEASPDAGGTVEAVDAGGTADAITGEVVATADAGSAPTGVPDGGCGCRASAPAGPSAGAVGLAGLLLLALALRRRSP